MELAELVALWAKYIWSVSEIAREVDILFTIIWDPQSVEDTYFWSEGILENMKPWSTVIDMTTTKPSLSVKIYNEAVKKDIAALDAPVSWGDTWAQQWTLSIMVWWQDQTFNEVLPLFELMGKSITHIAWAGTGQDTKMANQIAIAGNTIGMTESLLYAEKAWLDLEKTIKVLCAGWACSWGYINLAPRIVEWDFETYFFIKHYVKDMKIALEECKNMNISLPWLELVYKLYEAMMDKDQWDLWMQSLIMELKRINGLDD